MFFFTTHYFDITNNKLWHNQKKKIVYLPPNCGNAVNSRFLEILNRELLCRLSFFINGAVKLRPFAIGVCGGGVGRSLLFYKKKND